VIESITATAETIKNTASEMPKGTSDHVERSSQSGGSPHEVDTSRLESSQKLENAEAQPEHREAELTDQYKVIEPPLSEELSRPAPEAVEEQTARLQELGEHYMEELRDGLAEAGADYEHIELESVDPTTWERCSLDENRAARREYYRCRDHLIQAWVAKHDAKWPTYSENVPGPHSRRAGQNYDCHHIQPLCASGLNDVNNIVPLPVGHHMPGTPNGVHRAGSPLTRAISAIKGG
jgi:hypothetical protein